VDWQTEHLALVLNVGLIGGVSEATEHIAQFGSRHTEAICAEDRTVIKAFVEGVDASCVGVNVSTRFNDGGELGLGAEIGISTSKIHAYGAMGAGQLVATRFELEGSGHVRK
jgi:glutamate-5-semialdehyde dehydrogenase